MHPSYVPRTIPYSGSPLPSTGSRPMSVPPLQRYYQDATTSYLPSRRTSFPSLGGTTGAPSVRSKVARDAKATGRGTSATRWAPRDRPLLPWRRQDLPSSCGTPITCLHVLFDSGRTDSRLANNAAAGMAPAKGTTRASANRTFEAQSHGFQARCLRFAVRVTPTPRQTRFRLMARLYRVGFSPTGSR
jgi:hypothetical protein